jgi:hypothetical protein
MIRPLNTGLNVQVVFIVLCVFFNMILDNNPGAELVCDQALSALAPARKSRLFTGKYFILNYVKKTCEMVRPRSLACFL